MYRNSPFLGKLCQNCYILHVICYNNTCKEEVRYGKQKESALDKRSTTDAFPAHRSDYHLDPDADSLLSRAGKDNFLPLYLSNLYPNNIMVNERTIYLAAALSFVTGALCMACIQSFSIPVALITFISASFSIYAVRKAKEGNPNA